MRRAGALLVLLACAGCTLPQAQSRVAGALDVLATMIEPAYSFAVDTCLLGEESIVRGVQAGQLTPDQRAAEMGALRKRCDQITEGFARIRELHVQAAAFTNSGHAEEAWQFVREIQAQVQALPAQQQRGDPPLSPAGKQTEP